MAKINHTKDRSRSWSLDVYVPSNATPEVKMANAWGVIKDVLGDRAFKLAADIDVKNIEYQNSKAEVEWHIAEIECSARAYRAFEDAV